MTWRVRFIGWSLPHADPVFGSTQRHLRDTAPRWHGFSRNKCSRRCPIKSFVSRSYWTVFGSCIILLQTAWGPMVFIAGSIWLRKPCSRRGAPGRGGAGRGVRAVGSDRVAARPPGPAARCLVRLRAVAAPLWSPAHCRIPWIPPAWRADRHHPRMGSWSWWRLRRAAVVAGFARGGSEREGALEFIQVVSKRRL